MTDSTYTDAQLAALAAAVPATYEKNAARWDAERPKRLHERAWLDRLAALLPAGGRVLDLGCGAGDPIAGYFMAAGYRITGVDVAAAMLELARARWPDGDWRRMDMRALDLPERFDGIIGWNSFFHLTAADQRQVLPRLARHLAPSGALMLTVGPRAGTPVGRVGDDPIFHASLEPTEYRAILAAHDVTVVDFVAEDPDCDEQTVLLARRTP